MPLQTYSVTIPAGEALSSAANCGGSRVVRIVSPSGWTAAPLTFQLSSDGENWADLYHVSPENLFGYEVAVPKVVPGATTAMPAGMGSFVAWVRVRSGTRTTPVKQAEDRSFGIVVHLE